MLERKPENILRIAVSKMLPKDRLRNDRLARLKLFLGEKHEYIHKVNSPTLPKYVSVDYCHWELKPRKAIDLTQMGGIQVEFGEDHNGDYSITSTRNEGNQLRKHIKTNYKQARVTIRRMDKYGIKRVYLTDRTSPMSPKRQVELAKEKPLILQTSQETGAKTWMTYWGDHDKEDEVMGKRGDSSTRY